MSCLKRLGPVIMPLLRGIRRRRSAGMSATSMPAPAPPSPRRPGRAPAALQSASGRQRVLLALLDSRESACARVRRRRAAARAACRARRRGAPAGRLRRSRPTACACSKLGRSAVWRRRCQGPAPAQAPTRHSALQPAPRAPTGAAEGAALARAQRAIAPKEQS